MKRPPQEGQVFDAHGIPVQVILQCTACGSRGPLVDFGLRRMPDGGVRSISTCRRCRGEVTARATQAACGFAFDRGRELEELRCELAKLKQHAAWLSQQRESLLSGADYD